MTQVRRIRHFRWMQALARKRRRMTVNSLTIVEACAWYGVRKVDVHKNSDQREQSSQQGPRCSCRLEWRLHHPLQQHASRNIQQLVQNETVKELGALSLYSENGTYIGHTKIQQHGSTRSDQELVLDACETTVGSGSQSPSCAIAKNEIMDAGIDDGAIKVQRPNVVVVGRGPTKLEVEHHVAPGHALHRTWCDACMRARGIAGRHERREIGSSNKQTWSKACCSRFVHADLRSVGALKGTTFLRCRTRFVSCCRTSARRRVSRPRPTLARNRQNAPRDHTPFWLSAIMLQRTMCLRSSCPSAAAFRTASKQWHGMRMAIASLPTPTTKMVFSRLLFGTGRILQTCSWKFQQLGLRIHYSRLTTHCLASRMLGLFGLLLDARFVSHLTRVLLRLFVIFPAFANRCDVSRPTRPFRHKKNCSNSSSLMVH